MAMSFIDRIINTIMDREIDIGTKWVTRSFHSKPVMEATKNMPLQQQEGLIRPFLTVENRLHLEVKYRTAVQLL